MNERRNLPPVHRWAGFFYANGGVRMSSDEDEQNKFQLNTEKFGIRMC